MKEIAIQENMKSVIAPLSENRMNEKAQDGSFMDTLKDAIGDVNRLHEEADQAVRDLAEGKDANIHNTMIALEKAEISFQLMMQVRNKIISAYETIMRMNI